jgi:hypothetical protein
VPVRLGKAGTVAQEVDESNLLCGIPDYHAFDKVMCRSSGCVQLKFF